MTAGRKNREEEERGEKVARVRGVERPLQLERTIRSAIILNGEGHQGEYFAFSEVLKNCTNEVR